MNNKEYLDLVNAGEYPDDQLVPLDTPFVDARGIIQNIWLGQSGSITFIDSKQGAVRARHRHTEDWHGTYVISGKIKYIEGKGIEKQEFIFSVGELFFTRPGVYHEMHFIEDTKMITINNLCKNHDNYEKDVKR